MTTYSNRTQVPLSVAVYLALDQYDYVPGAISATSLIKSVRQQVLSYRVPKSEQVTEVTDVVKSRIGTSIHDGLERAWSEDNYPKTMLALGYPQKVIDRIVVNPGYIKDLVSGQLVVDPNAKPMASDAIPVYMEIRSFREIDGKTVSGKFDFLAEGRLEDYKSTSTYTWTNQTKTLDYQLQGSIYRWLNADKVTQDYIAIQFFFTDWAKGKSLGDPKYPQRQVEQQLIPLLSLSDTEDFIRTKLAEHAKYQSSDETDIPPCTDHELWRKAPVYKYYKNPKGTMNRSTKNFTNAVEAYARLVEDNNVGIVKEVPGSVMACNYCNAFPVCTQKDQLLADGSLTLM